MYSSRLTPLDVDLAGDVEGYHLLVRQIMQNDSDMSDICAGVGNKKQFVKISCYFWFMHIYKKELFWFMHIHRNGALMMVIMVITSVGLTHL